MDTEVILTVLKQDLQISVPVYDEMLTMTIDASIAAIKREGITLTDSIEDAMLVKDYAAWMYRNRKEGKAMPRPLRWQLNNRLFSEKGKWTE